MLKRRGHRASTLTRYRLPFYLLVFSWCVHLDCGIDQAVQDRQFNLPDIQWCDSGISVTDQRHVASNMPASAAPY